MALSLRHRTKRNRVMVTGSLCGAWHCETCRPYLKRKWTDHLTAKIMSSPDIFISLVPKARWDTVSRRIVRAGGQFAVLEQPGQIMVLFTTVAVGGQVVAKAQALITLTQALNNVITSHRPAHTSRGWDFPKEVNPKMSEWERVDSLPITVDEAKQVADALGLKTTRFWGEHWTGFVVDLPEDWEEPRVSSFFGMLNGVPGGLLC